MDKLERFIFQEGCTMWAVSASLVDNIYSSSLIGYQLQHVCTMVLLDVVNPRVPTNARHGSSFTEYEKKSQWCSTRLSVVWRRNYWLKSQTSVLRPTLKLLTRFPVDSSPRRLSFDRRWNFWLDSQSSVLRPTQKLLTHIPAICPPTVATTNNSRPRRLSYDRYRN